MAGTVDVTLQPTRGYVPDGTPLAPIPDSVRAYRERKRMADILLGQQKQAATAEYRNPLTTVAASGAFPGATIGNFGALLENNLNDFNKRTMPQAYADADQAAEDERQKALNEIMGGVDQVRGPDPAQVAAMQELGIDSDSMKIMFPQIAARGNTAPRELQILEKLNSLREMRKLVPDGSPEAKNIDMQIEELKLLSRPTQYFGTENGLFGVNPLAGSKTVTAPTGGDIIVPVADVDLANKKAAAEASGTAVGTSEGTKEVVASNAPKAAATMADMQKYIDQMPDSKGRLVVEDVLKWPGWDNKKLTEARSAMKTAGAAITFMGERLPGPASEADRRLMAESGGILESEYASKAERQGALNAAKDIIRRNAAKFPEYAALVEQNLGSEFVGSTTAAPAGGKRLKYNPATGRLE